MEVSTIFSYAVHIGESIKQMRRSQSLTQKALAEGICCQTTISHIENGQTLPSVDILHYLSKRLNVSIDYFFQKSEMETANYELTTTEVIEDLWKSKDYAEIHSLTSLERKQRGKRQLSHEFDIYIDLNYYLSASLLNILKLEECIKGLKSLVRDNNIHKPRFLDFRIKNAIANILVEHNKNKEAMRIFEELLRYPQTEHNYISIRLRLKVHFNLSRLYYQTADYQSAFTIASKGIKLSLKLEDMSMLGNLYVQAGQSLQKLDRNEEAMGFFHHAKTIFTLLKRDWYVSFVDDLLNEAKN